MLSFNLWDILSCFMGTMVDINDTFYDTCLFFSHETPYTVETSCSSCLVVFSK